MKTILSSLLIVSAPFVLLGMSYVQQAHQEPEPENCRVIRELEHLVADMEADWIDGPESMAYTQMKQNLYLMNTHFPCEKGD